MKLNQIKRYGVIIVILMLIFGVWGCKDSGQTDTASLLEECKLYLDEGEWSDAVDTCLDVETDEGYHYAAQAYMGLSGLSLLNLVRNMSNSSNSSGAATAIFSFVPDDATKRSYLKTALELLMGTKISNKSQTVYLEGLLVSSILVFAQLKDVFGLAEQDGSFTTCDIDVTDDTNPTKCSFNFEYNNIASTTTFSGLGSSLYQNLCCGSSDGTCTSVSSTYDDATADGVTYDVTIDSCTIESNSVLQYNKNAYDGFIVTDAFKDGNGNNVLSPLDFYTLFDSGNRYDISGDTVQLCNQTPFPDVTADSGAIYDCEVIGGIFDPNSELF